MSRWWRCSLSAVATPARRVARRTIANAVSMIGTPRMTSGMNSGAKKKYDDPLNSASVLPPTLIVDAAINRPSKSAPQSPMKMRAGWKLYGRNPRQMPSAITASSGPMLPGASTPASSSRSPYAKKQPAAIAVTPAARPSRPSMRLMALAMPTTHTTVMNAERSGVSENTPRNGTRKKIVLTPASDSTLPASTMPASLAGAETPSQWTLRSSSMSPTAKMSRDAATTPSGAVDDRNTSVNRP